MSNVCNIPGGDVYPHSHGIRRSGSCLGKCLSAAVPPMCEGLMYKGGWSEGTTTASLNNLVNVKIVMMRHLFIIRYCYIFCIVLFCVQLPCSLLAQTTTAAVSMVGKLNNQSTTPLSPLKIGDRIPDVTLVEFVNYKSKIAELSDFKGKLIILDFWNRWCTSCIRSFPHMEELQDKFGDKIAILLVTDDPMDAFEKLAKRSPTVRKTKLPFIIGDSILHALFPHSAVPYHVWINTEGNVMAMTTGSNATVSHIQDILDNKEVTLTTREDQLDFDPKMPLIKEGHGRQIKHLDYYSMIFNRLPGYSHTPSGLLMDTISGIPLGYRIINQSIINLYNTAYGSHSTFGNGEGIVIVESKNSDKFYPPTDIGKLSEWNKLNTFCYEFKWPATFLDLPLEKKIEKAHEFMKQDFDRYFQVRSSIETQMRKCLILYRVTKEDRLATKQECTKLYDYNKVNERTLNGGWIFKNVDFSIIPSKIRLKLSEGPKGIPIIDETAYQGRIDATFNCDFSDIEVTKSELAKYGLGIKEEVREITCLVLRDESE